MTGPLAGVRVLDLSRLVAGGVLGMCLADFGADVVKVEQPGRGDPLRTWTVAGQPLWWRVYGRNKRSITLNLDSAAGRDLLRQLVPRFDVLIESFVPGKLESWGIGPDTLHDWHPGIIVVRISGWGQTGPNRARPGFGTLVEAASGLAAMTGTPDQPPLLPPFPLADMYAALYAVNATLMALYHRDLHDGGGQTIDVALFDAVFSVLGPLAAEYAASGQVRTRASGGRSQNSAPRGVYRTADDAYLAVSASTPDTAERFLRAYGLGELLADPRFATNEARVTNAVALDAIVVEAMARHPIAEHRRIVTRHRLTAVPIQTIADIAQDPHWQARELTVDLADDDGAVRMHNVVPRLSQTAGQIRWPGPPLGAHNQEIFEQELGLAPEEVQRLRQAGIV
ncbi:MAG: CoA transferase [Chloroflexia bacterium]|nr:CoA transferase [Chloroflexia bacterium]MDQ3411861.1 CoA transferase [Chloroflexota bacterium]